VTGVQTEVTRHVTTTQGSKNDNDSLNVPWGTLKMRDMNLRDMIVWHNFAGVENAGHENEGNAIVWNTECCICLSIAEQDCMSASPS